MDTFYLLLITVPALHAQDYRGKVEGGVTDSTQAVGVGAKVSQAKFIFS